MAVRKEGRHRLKEKLKEVECHKQFIINYVEDLSAKAREQALSIQKEKDKHVFMERLVPVTNNVETVVTKLFKLKAAIAEAEGQLSSSTSGSESDSDSDSNSGERKSIAISSSANKEGITKEAKLVKTAKEGSKDLKREDKIQSRGIPFDLVQEKTGDSGNKPIECCIKNQSGDNIPKSSDTLPCHSDNTVTREQIETFFRGINTSAVSQRKTEIKDKGVHFATEKTGDKDQLSIVDNVGIVKQESPDFDSALNLTERSERLVVDHSCGYQDKIIDQQQTVHQETAEPILDNTNAPKQTFVVDDNWCKSENASRKAINSESDDDWTKEETSINDTTSETIVYEEDVYDLSDPVSSFPFNSSQLSNYMPPTPELSFENKSGRSTPTSNVNYVQVDRISTANSKQMDIRSKDAFSNDVDNRRKCLEKSTELKVNRDLECGAIPKTIKKLDTVDMSLQVSTKEQLENQENAFVRRQHKPSSPSSPVVVLSTGKRAPKILKSKRVKSQSECSSKSDKKAKSTTSSHKSSTTNDSLKSSGALMTLDDSERSSEIAQYRLKEDGSLVEVLITEVISPSLFWIQPLICAEHLINLMAEMNAYHSKIPSSSPYYKLRTKPLPGMVVMAKYSGDDQWYRARIVAVWQFKEETPTESKKRHVCQVLYVDYGNREKLGLDRLRPIHAAHLTLPAQSFPCCLTGVSPLASGWTPDQCKDFTEFCSTQKIIYATFYPFNNCPLTFVDLHVPEPSISTEDSAGATLRSLLNVGEMFIYELGSAMAETNDKLHKDFYKWCKLFTPELSPSLKGAVREIKLHAYSQPCFEAECDPQPFLSDATQKSESPLKVKETEPEESKTKKRSQEAVNKEKAKVTGRKELTEREKENEAKKKKLLEIWEDRLKPDWKGLYTIAVNKVPLHSEKFFADVEKFGLLEDVNDTKHVLYIRFKSKEEALNVLKNLHSIYQLDVPLTKTQSVPGRGIGHSPGKFSPLQQRKSIAQEKEKVDENVYEKQIEQSIPPPHPDFMDDDIDDILDEEVAKSVCSFQGSSPLAQDMHHSKQSPELDTMKNLSFSQDTTSQSQSSTSIVSVQRLLDKGLPSRLPGDCKHAANYTNLMTVENTDVNTSPRSLVDSEGGGDGPNIQHKEMGLSEFQTCHDALEVQIPEDGCLKFLLAYIHNPSKFYIHLCAKSAAETVETLMDELNKYYQSPHTNKFLLKKFFNTSEPKINDVICAMYSEDNKFYRAEILDMCRSEEGETRGKVARLKVFYMDFGNDEWVSINNIVPLPAQFINIPPQAVCCSLAGVTNPNATTESDSKGVAWLQDTVQEFIQITGFENILHGYVCGLEPGSCARPNEKEPLRLLVVDTNGERDVWMNEELQSRGLALFTPPPEYTEQMQKLFLSAEDFPVTSEITVQDEIAEWNPMVEDYLGERNSYMVDTDDPGVATMGYSDKLLQVPVMDRGSYTEQWLNNICVQHSSCSSKKKPAVKLSKWIDLTVNFISHKEKESAMLIKQCDNAIVAVKCSPLSCLLEKVQTTPNLGYHTNISQIQNPEPRRTRPSIGSRKFTMPGYEVPPRFQKKQKRAVHAQFLLETTTNLET